MFEQPLDSVGPFDPLFIVVLLVLFLLAWAGIAGISKFLVGRAMNHAMTEIEAMLYHFDFLRTEAARDRTTVNRLCMLLHRAKHIAEHSTIPEARDFERDWRALFHELDPLAVENENRIVIRRPKKPKKV